MLTAVKPNIRILKRFVRPFYMISTIMPHDHFPTSETVEPLTAAQLVRVQCSIADPWNFYQGFIHKHTLDDTIGEAVRYMLDRGYDFACDTAAEEGTSALQPFNDMAMNLLSMAATEVISLYGKKTHEKGMRPSDIYRRWMPGLRWIHANFAALKNEVEPVIREILADQTMPYAELDTPSWVDGYTFDVEPETDIISIKVEKTQESETYSEGFDSEDGLDIELDEERSDDLEPTWMQIQHEFQDLMAAYDARAVGKVMGGLGSSYEQTRAQVVDQLADLAASKLRKVTYEQAEGAINEMLDRCEVPNPLKRKLIETFDFHIDGNKLVFVEHGSGANQRLWTLHNAIWTLAKANHWKMAVKSALAQFSPVHVAMWIARNQEERNIPDFVFEMHTRMASYPKLGQLVDEIIEETAMKDDGVSNIEILREEIELFCDETIEMYQKVQGKPESKNPQDHPAFIKGWLTAACNARQSTVDACISAAWDEWRKGKSVEGNFSFHCMIAAGATHKEAMSVFWGVTNGRIGPKTLVEAKHRLEAMRNPQQSTPLPRQMPGIKSVRPTGLVLSNGREVNWYVAMLKIRGSEIDLDEAGKGKLKTLLEKQGWGAQLVAVL